MLFALIILNGLAALVIFVNWSSWRWRLTWILILAVSMIFLPGSFKLLGPIVLIVILASLQSIYNMRHSSEDD